METPGWEACKQREVASLVLEAGRSRSRCRFRVWRGPWLCLTGGAGASELSGVPFTRALMPSVGAHPHDLPTHKRRHPLIPLSPPHSLISELQLQQEFRETDVRSRPPSGAPCQLPKRARALFTLPSSAVSTRDFTYLARSHRRGSWDLHPGRRRLTG